MRVLFVNWADPLDRYGRGGGVSVYQRNLMSALAGSDQIEAAFLSAGLSHDLLRRQPRVERIAGPGPARFELINSGLVAPSHADFAGAAQLDHPETEAAFARFIDQTGPWDVIHFNNLEGLPAHVLALRPRWPGTRFIVALHNYYPFCPQVNFWYRESKHCTDFEGGARCVTCLPVQPDPRHVRLSYRLDTALTRLGIGPGTRTFRWLCQPIVGLTWRVGRQMLRARHQRAVAAPRTANDGTPFARRRARMVALLNHHADAILCVSDRVRQIAVAHGIEARKARICRIGTKAAEAWEHTRPRPAFLGADGTVRLLYLGYMRRDKGFHFLMRALASLPPETAQRLHLTVAARTGEEDAMALMTAARARLAGLTHVNGYTHADLPALIDGADLGIVPPLWEDNMPQVAIEMHARHLPLLTSDRGGAQELGNCPDLVFRAGDAADLHRVLADVLAGRVTPDRYWAGALPPVTLDSHLRALLEIYRAPAASGASGA